MYYLFVFVWGGCVSVHLCRGKSAQSSDGDLGTVFENKLIEDIRLCCKYLFLMIYIAGTNFILSYLFLKTIWDILMCFVVLATLI